MQKQPPADQSLPNLTAEERNAIATMQQKLKHLKPLFYHASGMLIAFPEKGVLIPVGDIKAYKSVRGAFETIIRFDPDVPVSREQGDKLIAAMHLLEPRPEAQNAPRDEKTLRENMKTKQRRTYSTYCVLVRENDAVYQQDTAALMHTAFSAIRRAIAEQGQDKSDFEDRFGDRSSRGDERAR